MTTQASSKSSITWPRCAFTLQDLTNCVALMQCELPRISIQLCVVVPYPGCCCENNNCRHAVAVQLICNHSRGHQSVLAFRPASAQDFSLGCNVLQGRACICTGQPQAASNFFKQASKAHTQGSTELLYSIKAAIALLPGAWCAQASSVNTA